MRSNARHRGGTARPVSSVLLLVVGILHCGSSEPGGRGVSPEELLARFEPFGTEDQMRERMDAVRNVYAPFQGNLYREKAPAARATIELDGPWRFRLDRAGSAWANGEIEGWFEPGHDDSGWMEVSLPEWAEYSRGWLRTRFDLSDPTDGRRRFLVLEGVDHEIRAWVNGRLVLGPRKGHMFARLAVDVTGELVAGENVLAIELVNFWDPLHGNFLQVAIHDGRDGRPAHGAQFGNGALLQSARIEETGPVHVRHFTPIEDPADRLLRGVSVRPRAAQGRFDVGFAACNETDTREEITAALEARPRNFDGPVSIAGTVFAVEAGACLDPIWVEVPLTAPRLWSLESPFLYEVEVTLEGRKGELLDRVHDRAGLRDLGQTESGGLTLNGKEVFVRGGVGWLPPGDSPEELMLLFRSANLNAVKANSTDILEFADSYGLLAYADLFTIGHPLEWFEDLDQDLDPPVREPEQSHDEWWAEYREWFDGIRQRDGLEEFLATMLHELIDSVKNHPSVAFYAPTHENDPFRANLELDALLHRTGGELDPTRIVSPNSGRGYVPGYPYDERGCADEGACWRMLDHHSHECWYGSQPLDYWSGRTLLYFDDYSKPPYDGDGNRINFWGSDRHKAIFSELAGAESLPVWETLVEWNDLGVFDPPVTSRDDLWKPTWIRPLDLFLAGEDEDDGLFRPPGKYDERASYDSYATLLGDRFMAAAGWCIRLGNCSDFPEQQGDAEDDEVLPPIPISSWIQGSQSFQSSYLRLSIDALRRQRQKVVGYFFFAVKQVGSGFFTKAVVDEQGHPKAGYYALADASAPVRVQIRAGDSGRSDPRTFHLCVDRESIDVWVLNDEHSRLDGHTVHVIAAEAGTLSILHASAHPIDVPPFSSIEAVSDLDLGLDPGVPMSLIALLTGPVGEIVDGDYLKQPTDCP